MNVQKLIQQLQKLPQDAEVFLSLESAHVEIEMVSQEADDLVLIQGKD